MTELPATFGKYFLTEQLAIGGMAAIYLGKLIGPGGFEKQLVIKQIHPRLAAERHFVDLFVAEAKTLVGLSHGNIVPVYELGIVDDTYFIAMEYIDGPTLFQLTESVWRAGAGIAAPIAAWIAAEVLDGLDYAHRKGAGVIHRDLSPRNVMLSRDGQVLLVDFGIAVPFGADDDAAAAGAPTGSFPYMSPEQVERRPLTTASDLFSASVLLWEMLAGRRLFHRANADETLEAVRTAPIPPPSRLRPEVPARLDEVVLRGLERDPARRWDSAGELLAALNKYLYGLEDVPGARNLEALIARHCPPVPRRRRDDGTGEVQAISGELRRPAVREHSFATHVEIERVLGATPLFPLRAIPDHELRALAGEPVTDAVPAVVVSNATKPLPRISGEAPVPAPSSEPEPTSHRLLRAAAITMAVIAAIAVAVWLAVRPGPIPAVADRGDAGVDAAPATVAVIDVDAAPTLPPDAAPAPEPIDTGVGPRGPRRPPTVPRDAEIPPRAEPGRIKVGANPWGEVLIDGKKVGNAPGQWPVRPGRHQVIVLFPGEAGEVRRSFTVEVAAGRTEAVFADFSE